MERGEIFITVSVNLPRVTQFTSNTTVNCKYVFKNWDFENKWQKHEDIVFPQHHVMFFLFISVSKLQGKHIYSFFALKKKNWDTLTCVLDIGLKRQT